MDMPGARDFFGSRDAEADISPLDEAIERSTVRAMAEQEKSVIVSGINGILIMAFAASYLEAALLFVPILALRCLCIANNYWVSRRIIERVQAGEPVDREAARFDRAMVVNGASWGIVTWPVGLTFSTDLAAFVIVMTVVVSVGFLSVAISVRPRAMIRLIAAFGAIALIPFALSIPIAGPLPLLGAFAFIAAVGCYAARNGRRVRDMLGIRVENQLLVEELGKTNGRLSTALAAAERLAEEDSLTGLLNRRAFDARAAELMEGAGKTRRIYLLLADIDRFKAINDTFGHAVGDTVIQLTADALAQSCGAKAICSRWGGEEFLVALALDGDAAAREAVRRVTADVDAAGARLGVEGIQVSVSIGHARWSPLEPLDDAIHRADEAMYRAKKQRRGEWQASDSVSR